MECLGGYRDVTVKKMIRYADGVHVGGSTTDISPFTEIATQSSCSNSLGSKLPARYDRPTSLMA